ncbi:hypothetical protein [Aromatoleum diolicum]|uniref:Uncharacterized protein n=1 Tax=Aromatoleum diolicum TaxID=75796 RepID=A0ABX1QEG0_9RHOO|nr:hypothetical protein [Aromatoleum diolicum]NMG76365.1 hypothetical protein [Aromatoleum diolicum]
MKSRTRVASVVVVLAAMGAWAGPASAVEFVKYSGECATELNAVGQAIEDATFLGNKATTDESNLFAKLDAANAKVGLEKYDDAVDKLMNIVSTATALANAAKPKLDSAYGINTAAGAAMDCVGALGN